MSQTEDYCGIGCCVALLYFRNNDEQNTIVVYINKISWYIASLFTNFLFNIIKLQTKFRNHRLKKHWGC